MAQSLAELIVPFLDELKARRISNKTVAAKLGYSAEHVSRTLTALGIEKEAYPPNKRQRNHELAVERDTYRDEVANSNLTPKQAAKAAKCSLRTIYRRRRK